MTNPRGRGRPRSVENDGAILAAAAALLRDAGYARMSMEGVAAAAGVSKPTLYLRYASKSELVVAVLVHLRVGGAPELTGDLRADVVAQLRHLRQVYERTGMSLIGTCLAEEPRLPDLISELRARSLIPGRQLLRSALVAARDRGEIDENGDIEVAIETAIGAYYARYLAGDPFDDDWEERVADVTLRGLGATV